MSPDSKIWIYQADRLLTDDEVAIAQKLCDQFSANWNSHGTELASSIEIRNNLHIVVAVDESHKDASGCSIDSSVRFIKELGAHLNVDFFNRLNIAKITSDTIKLLNINNLENGLSPDDLIYDNTITKYEDLSRKWKVPANQAWCSHLLAV